MVMGCFLDLINAKYTCTVELYFLTIMKGLKRNRFAAVRQNDLAGSTVLCASSSSFAHSL